MNGKNYTIGLLIASVGMWLGIMGLTFFILTIRKSIEEIMECDNIISIFYAVGDFFGVLMIIAGIKLLRVGVKKARDNK